jgi:hypothetical protein
MPPTTRSIQGRLPNTTSSSPYVQAGPSRGSTQQGPSPRATNATTSDVVSNDDDDDDDDASEEEEEDDEEEDDRNEEESDDEDDSDSDDDNDDIPTKILKIFAIAEPNGLIESEIRTDAVNAQANQAS